MPVKTGIQGREIVRQRKTETGFRLEFILSPVEGPE
jgi:hypothetical protein